MLPDECFVQNFITRYSPQVKDMFLILENSEKIYFTSQKRKNTFKILNFSTFAQGVEHTYYDE